MSGGPTPTESGGRWRLWASIATIVLAAIFILQNSKEVSVDFIFWTITAPLIFALAFAVLLGLVIGLLMPRGRGSSPANK
ncbi:MAG: DUF1049 domain-containing protein [Actinobacteria bacterium]|nr:DUF1049 domain-containing protein [Actinomycetota bacterium]